METIWAVVTSRVTEALTDPRVAVMMATPELRPLASPLELPTFATAALDEVQAT